MNASASAPRSGPPDTFWRSLHFFNLYRLGVATVFVCAILIYSGSLSFGSQNPGMFATVSSAYLLLALLFYIALQLFKRGFNLHLTLQVAIDILALTLLMFASGGAKSGMAFMLLVVLAGAGLVGQGRLTLFYAALATLAVLLEQGYRVLQLGGNAEDFIQTGITCVGFFATAITARLLARRVVANEELARRRGIELGEQMSINQRVIRDMQDGVLVVGSDGLVHQYNPQAEKLLGASAPPMSDLAAFSLALAEYYPRWHLQAVETAEILRDPATGRSLRARFLPAGEGGNALIYIEDLDRELAQTQQLKLAALGRLTANMAHEIRNPLSAISHAAELLAEEQGGVTQARLTRIIGDNSQRLNRLVAEVLELGRRDRAQPEMLSLDPFIETFLDEYAVNDNQVKEIVELSVDQGAMLNFDRSHLNQVLWNLLDNALRYCLGRRGSIKLETRPASTPGRTELHIIDDGTGIGPSHRSQVFEPFFTTHSSGTGLGLYIARELCEANGALLEIRDNAPGAHFCLTGKGE
ncbi:MAG: sensor histidine kinase [Rhodocyclaceae bacterium]|nr:MAG: sensor histidine kinase [Rhodocyclaceae bacterium]